jgi:integrase
MKVSLYLKRPKATDSTAIFARISFNGCQLKYYLPENINPKFWNKQTQRAKQTEKYPEYPEFNSRLDNLITDIKDTYREYLNNKRQAGLTVEMLKVLLDDKINPKRVRDDQSKTLIGVFKDLIAKSKSGVRLHPKTGKPLSVNTLKTYNTTFNHLTAFQETRKKPIEFADIDLDFYTDYKEFLMKGAIKNPDTGKFETLNLSTNTVGKHIQIIKLVLNEATERGINTNLAFKGKRFVTIRENSDSIYLTESELQEIELLDLAKDKKLERVRDLFLIGCYTGLRYSDYSILKPEQIVNGYIETTQIKTGDSVVIPIHTTVKRILDKYNGVLPESISNQKTNQYLKELGKKVKCLQTPFAKTITKGGLAITNNLAKWELLSTHTGRRSFATNEYLAGTPTVTIMAITGHRTEKAFLRYIKLSKNEHAKLLKMHWDKRQQMKAV